ncbi:MAG: DsrH/TusB family sulfur metabolism protein, partial [Lysobacterales bacterium]
AVMSQGAGLVMATDRENHVADEPGESCLHLVMHANRNAWDNCQACCGPGDTIVLMNTAVTLMAGPLAINPSEVPIPVFCLAADVRAHGLHEHLAGRNVTMIDDHGLVRLVCLHRHCLSWK